MSADEPEDLKTVTAWIKSLRQGQGLAKKATLLSTPAEVQTLLHIDGAAGSSSVFEQVTTYLATATEGLTAEDKALFNTVLNVGGHLGSTTTSRMGDLAVSLSQSSKTIARRFDTISREVALQLLRIRASIGPPNDTGSFEGEVFPIGFDSFPAVFTADGLDNIAIVVGSTEREREGDASLFGAAEIDTSVDGMQLIGHRQPVAGTVRDIVRIVDLVALLASDVAMSVPVGAGICVPDVAVTAGDLTKNIILVGGADTNVYIGLASMLFARRFKRHLPVRYRADSLAYFTCDEIISETSGAKYPRLEESGAMHCGYLVLSRNPWNPTNYMLIVSGTRGTGTQAALLALCQPTDELYRSGQSPKWRSLGGNNRYDDTLPAKVVRATRARVATGAYLDAPGEEIRILPTARISQRHLITDYVFEE